MSNKATRIFLFLLVAFVAFPALASETIGTISDTQKYAWGENMGWVNFHGLTITDTAITGYAWSKEFGWINFSPTNSGQGVANTEEGTLSGKAWVATLGWLDMQGVTINESGKFVGVAGSEESTLGRVSFDCDNCDVITDWRPLSAREVDNGGRSTGGSGSIGENIAQSNPQQNQFKTDTSALTTSDQAIADYVESHNAPLTIEPHQHGLLVYDFGNGVGATVRIPTGAADTGIVIEVSVHPAIPGEDGPFTYIFGGMKFIVIAKDLQGNPVHLFNQNLEITLTLPDNLLNKSDLGVYWMDTAANAWMLVKDATLANNTATFLVDHLTEFAILKAKGLPETISLASTYTALSNRHYRFLWILLLILLVFARYWYVRNIRNSRR